MAQSSAPDAVAREVQGNKSLPENCGEIISTLPKERAWISEHYYKYQGFWYSPVLLVGTIWAQASFKARDTDILLSTFPKSGTTWTKALMFAIVNRKRHPPHLSSPSSHPLLTKNPHNCVPFLEFQVHMRDDPVAYLDSLPSPRLLAAHIPYTSLPESFVRDSGSRIVYIARNPRDVFISYFMFSQKLRSDSLSEYRELFQPTPPAEAVGMEEAFELFCKGVAAEGPFWDHVLDYWKASLERPHQVLFMKYEDMKKDTTSHVKRLAEFIGYPFSLEEEGQGVVDDLIELCSFDNLSNLEVNKSGTLHIGSQTLEKVSNNSYFRRGEVGDSENHLTAEMLDSIDKITDQKLSPYGLKF